MIINVFLNYRLISRLSCILEDNNNDANRIVRHINTLVSMSKQKLRLIKVSLQQKVLMFENNLLQTRNICFWFSVDIFYYVKWINIIRISDKRFINQKNKRIVCHSICRKINLLEILEYIYKQDCLIIWSQLTC